MIICIIGMGYVGLPLAVAFSKKFKVIGFDINKNKINELKNNIDKTNEITKQELENSKIEFTDNEENIKDADFIIIAVPTPIDSNKLPDMAYLQSASKIVGRNLKRSAIIVFESTVYPGATEEVCLPIIEKESNLKCPADFKIGYSPERINPGDKEHTVTKIKKVVSGIDKEALDIIDNTYKQIIEAGTYRARNIKTAEAAKVIENIQRDLNIALVNELSLIFEKLNIDTKDVIEAASTKWNFHKFLPGLVGGHCIGVDPYYLTYKANQLGYYPKVILAGRETNEFMSKHVADIIIKALIENKKQIIDSKILILGLTFKENVPDTRNSKVKDIIRYLKEYSVKIKGHDPLANIEEFNIEKHKEDNTYDAVLVFSPHKVFKELTLKRLKQLMPTPILIDIKGFYNKEEAIKEGFYYRTL